VSELRQKMQQGAPLLIVDVREPFEFEIARVEGSTLIPLNELSSRLDELDSGKEIIALCKSGVRSAHAVQFLRSAGYDRSFNLDGGIDAWAAEIDPGMTRY
jgi:adenylyltransferase/sulfurtransferase